MKGITKKIIAITLLIQIIISGLMIAPNSYAMEIDPEQQLTYTNYLIEQQQQEQETSGEGEDSSEADPFSKVLDGLAGILVLPVKILPLIVGKVLTWVMNILAGEGITGTLSVEDILFNNVKLTGVNFFELNSGDATVDQIRKSVSIWYYGIRNLAAILLVVIIVYVGIRMAISTIAEDKAKYKQMLIDWITGLALLFVLHYLMVVIVNVNNILVDVLDGARTYGTTVYGVNAKFDSALDTLFTNGLGIGFTQGFGSAICYVLLVGVTFLFLLSYIKRMITIAFLIVIAPLVTVTYSIDKMGDSKSQALNTWLKEFSYNILIQPFQCVTYLALGQTAIGILNEGFSLKAVIIAIAMLIFILTSEKIIKHIFHFESQSMSDTLASAVGGATLISLLGKGKSGGSKGGSGGGGGSSNKFADPEKSMTTSSSNARNVSSGGNPNRVTSANRANSRGSAVGGSGGSSTGGSSTGGSSSSGSGSSQTSGTSTRSSASNAGTVVNTNSTNTSRSRSGGSGALGAVGAMAGKWARTGIKYGAYATGAMLAMGATGSVDKGLLQGSTIMGNSVARRQQTSETNRRRRALAKAYNDYANTIAMQNPNLTPEEVNNQVRKKAVEMIQGKVQGPLTEEEEEFQKALKGMMSNYEKNGMSEEKRNEALNKDFTGIETGAISETSAPTRYVGKIKSTASRIANRRGKWGFAGGRSQNGNNQPQGGSSGSARTSPRTVQTPENRSSRQTPSAGQSRRDGSTSGSSQGQTGSSQGGQGQSGQPQNRQGQNGQGQRGQGQSGQPQNGQSPNGQGGPTT